MSNLGTSSGSVAIADVGSTLDNALNLTVQLITGLEMTLVL